MCMYVGAGAPWAWEWRARRWWSRGARALSWGRRARRAATGRRKTRAPRGCARVGGVRHGHPRPSSGVRVRACGGTFACGAVCCTQVSRTRGSGGGPDTLDVDVDAGVGSQELVFSGGAVEMYGGASSRQPSRKMWDVGMATGRRCASWAGAGVGGSLGGWEAPAARDVRTCVQRSECRSLWEIW